MRKSYSIIMAVFCLFIAGCAPQDPTEKKIEDLLSQMTLREKIGQMNQLSGGYNVIESAKKGELGSILNCVDPAEINAVQKAAVEESRLGIPVIVARDVIHGFHTMFPIPLGLASTFDPELVEKGARISSIEATSFGIKWTCSPMLDIARDSRWGRVAEGSGEDVYLDATMGAAMVRGYQGTNTLDPTSMAACVKHFVGYGAAEGGRDYNGVSITERSLRNTYLPPFKAAIDAGALTLMTSFNENDGIPSTGNKWLLSNVLRDEWGFDGMIVTDWNSAGEMIAHGFASDLKHSAELSVNAGVDMDMMSFGFINHLEELVKEGKVSEKSIDDAVRNILRLKFRMGIFDNPYVDEAQAGSMDYAEEHLAAAKQAALESAILLKNDGVLPLKSAKTILLVGPMADNPYDQMGTWTFDGQEEHTVTPLAALKKDFNVIYDPILSSTRDLSTTNISKVRSLSGRADAIVVVVGEEAIMSGEAHSMSDLDLKGAQSALIAEAAKTGKPVVVVVMAGRELTIKKDLDNCGAMLYCFHPGTMGGEALADLLTGRECPSGKLPMTMLVEAGQAPFYYNHNRGGRPSNGTETLLYDIPVKAGQTSLGNTTYYLDSGYGPLFPFGYGLSYTEFKIDNVVLDKTAYGKDETVKVSYDITNVGSVKGTEVVQLYINDVTGSVARPVKELKRFERVTLDPGQKLSKSFDLPVSDLAFYGLDLTCKVESGAFKLWVSNDSDSGEPVDFEVK